MQVEIAIEKIEKIKRESRLKMYREELKRNRHSHVSHRFKK